MSLQVWLPLNGNLDNQGLSDSYVVSSGNAVVNNEGKFGQCYYFNGTNPHFMLSENYRYIIDGEFSIGLWFKTSGLAQGQTSNGIFSITPCLTCYISADGQLRARFLDATSDNHYSCDVKCADNIWHCFYLTYDKHKAVLYLDGKKTNTYTRENFTPHHTQQAIIGTEINNANRNFCGSMNDIRIYDHCLSAKEVKEISKGLVVHYKLDNNGMGNPNLFKNAMNFNLNGSDYPSLSTRTLGKIEVKSDERGNAYNWAHPYIVGIEDIFNSTKTCTLSMDIKVEGEIKNNSEGYIQIDYRRSEPSYHLVVSKKNLIFDGQWHRYEVPITSDNDGEVSSLINMVFQNLNGVTIYYKDIKFEDGGKATPYCPAPTDTLSTQLGLNNLIELDHSGYGYDGTISGSYNYDSTTPRNDTSIVPQNNTTHIVTPIINTSGFSNTFTISWWSKITSMAGKMPWGSVNGNRLNLFPSSYFCCNTADSDRNPFKKNNVGVAFTPYNGTWHHYVMTGNGSTNILYIDGAEVGRSTTYKPLTATQFYISGWSASTDYKWIGGSLSDFRIYSTPFSADDVKELYETSAVVDNNGNVYCNDFKEVE